MATTKEPSTPSATNASSTTANAKGKSSTFAPVELVDNPLARPYSYIHVLIVLSTFFYSFDKLVADPVTTMIGSLLPVALLQGVYLALCLPATASSTPSVTTQKVGIKRKQAVEQVGLAGRIVPTILSLTVALTLATPLLTAGLILFGAPVTTHQLHTLLCAAHLSLLATPQQIYVHGLDGPKWRLVASLVPPIDEVVGASLGTLLGAWVGAVPIPLDWDREWQRWPVTVLAGGYIGWGIGKVLGGTIGKGARIVLDA